MMARSLAILCFFIVGFVRGITVEERLNELERVIILQSETLSQHESLIRDQRDKLESVHNENYLLKNRVEVLEDAMEQLYNADNDDVDGQDKPETEDDQQVVSGDVHERRDSSIQRDEHRINLQDKPQRRLALPLVSKKVAFYARSLVNHCLNNNDVLVFGIEDIDAGNGYNTHSGIYVVPVTGAYVFTWTVTTSDFWYTAELMINGHSRGKASADSYDDGQLVEGTGVIVASVVAGDQVFIRRSAGDECRIYPDGAQQTTFAGWLLF